MQAVGLSLSLPITGSINSSINMTTIFCVYGLLLLCSLTVLIKMMVVSDMIGNTAITFNHDATVVDAIKVALKGF